MDHIFFEKEEDTVFVKVNYRLYGVRAIWNDNGEDRTHIFDPGRMVF